MPRPLSILGSWIAESTRQHDIVAKERATMALVDTVACLFAGKDAEPTRRAREVISKWGAGPCTLIGRGWSAAPWAALVNGTAAHALDFDDNDTPAASHPSAVLFPCLIALAEERDLGGRELLDAYLVGLEVMSRIGEAVNMTHYSRGWHATATLGVLGAAAAGARLLRLDSTAASTCLSLATSMAGGLRSQFGTMAKPLHAGLAGKSAVLAACLAEGGFSASMDSLDGPLGFRSMFAGDGSPGFQDLERSLGRPLAIVQYGLSVKSYPCCYYSARSIDAALELRREHQFEFRDVDRVVVELSDRNAQIISVDAPSTPDEARFSLRYCLAVAFVKGKPAIEHFTEESLSDPELRDFMKRIEIKPYPGNAASSDLTPEEPDTVTISLEDGSRMAKTIRHAKGSSHLPLSRREALLKLRDCANGLSQLELRNLEDSLLSFDSLTSIKPLSRLFHDFRG
jgi:2-methylcitrate dehydratase PrpD